MAPIPLPSGQSRHPTEPIPPYVPGTTGDERGARQAGRAAQASGSRKRYTRAALTLVASATCSSGKPFSSATFRAVSST